jgi:hypothetical protein
VYEPLDVADIWLMVRGVKDEEGWGSCCCVALSPDVGTPTIDHKGGSRYVDPVGV